MTIARRKVVLVNFGCDAAAANLTAMMDRFFHAKELAQSLTAFGWDVTVLQAFRENGEHEVEGVAISTFAVDMPRLPQFGNGVLRFLGLERGNTQESDRALPLLKALDPDVVHFFGFQDWLLAAPLAQWARGAGRCVSWADHGGSPSRHPIRRRRVERALGTAFALFTPSPERRQMWIDGQRFGDGQNWEVQPELSTQFPFLPQAEARAKTGIAGTPAILSTSNLIAGKRPHLMLDAFAALLEQQPAARLYLAYVNDTMLDKITSRLAQDDTLRETVTLLGRIDRADIADYYNSADIYFLTSEKEIGSASLSEALACGTRPVCTDLPSLRALTLDLGAAVFFPLAATGRQIAQAMLPVVDTTPDTTRRRIRAHFDQHLSYHSIAHKMTALWEISPRVGG